MTYTRKAGATNVSVDMIFLDSTDGSREVGVVAATAGLALWYQREGEARVSLSSVNDLSALTDAHNDEGILHISDGQYRLDLPDTALASGPKKVLYGGLATGMIGVGGMVELVADDPFVAMNSLTNIESYHTKGNPATLAELNWAIYSLLTSALKNGTVMTIRKQDGTQAFTLALNHPTTPTDVIRTT